ncbi:fumarylacetoacetate hydrolase family protein [Hyphomicrobium sp. CS1BSMeth3]|uniref:2-keto-4-pentenoate hydratase n=1 Tax=Hyphomicrobium sp. CS1BSMeth3 TaxID=1892844 RepID=UPI000930C606|nr:fumarylacetoacetate hydrolase family protein [Hyphomicrobium sp. CS1BSMeth3]
MDSARFEAAAETLATVRREGRLLERLPEASRPRSLAEGYEIQNAFIKTWPDKLAGWKIGATSHVTMERFGVSEPIYGPFFARDVHTSPATPTAGSLQHMAIESEFAYRLGKDLPARPAPYAREEILDAIDAVIPCFEIISPRFVRMPFDDVASAVADCMLNYAMILGTPITDWRGIDAARHPVQLRIDGMVTGEGSGSECLGDPRNVLDWVVEKLRAAGTTLRQGEILSTGTCTGIVPLQRGQTAVADFGALGKVEVRFS